VQGGDEVEVGGCKQPIETVKGGEVGDVQGVGCVEELCRFFVSGIG
jgi:hypothetical protein